MKKSLITALVAIFLLSSAATLNGVFAQDEMGRIKVQIPSWIKTTAIFWVNDQSSDQEFLSALEFLIDNDIIRVPKIAHLENQVLQLQDDNELLRTQIDKDGVTKPTMPDYFVEIGSYTTTAYTEGQTQADGITIELQYDGRFVSRGN